MQVTATEAKNRFGYFCAQAKTEPVVVEKDGRPDSVIVSYENFRAMKEAAEQKTTAQRQREFNEKYKDWFAEQNRIVEEFGVFGEEYRPW
jgi:prevent-host-death family protein